MKVFLVLFILYFINLTECLNAGNGTLLFNTTMNGILELNTISMNQSLICPLNGTATFHRIQEDFDNGTVDYYPEIKGWILFEKFTRLTHEGHGDTLDLTEVPKNNTFVFYCQSEIKENVFLLDVYPITKSEDKYAVEGGYIEFICQSHDTEIYQWEWFVNEVSFAVVYTTDSNKDKKPEQKVPTTNPDGLQQTVDAFNYPDHSKSTFSLYNIPLNYVKKSIMCVARSANRHAPRISAVIKIKHLDDRWGALLPFLFAVVQVAIITVVILALERCCRK